MPVRLLGAPVSTALGGDKGCRPFPRTPFSASGILPSLRYGQVSLDEGEHFLHNRGASVATIRWCSGSSRNAVRNRPGISVRLRRNPHQCERTLSSITRACKCIARANLYGIAQSHIRAGRPSIQAVRLPRAMWMTSEMTAMINRT